MKKAKKRNKGFSLIELLIVVAIILIIAAIAIPNLLKARRSANEGSATASMRTIGSGELLYRSTQGAFTTLAGLSADGVIDNVLGAGSKSGYQFVASPGAGTLAPLQFTATAQPLAIGGPTASGTRYYFTDESQVIRYSLTAVPDSTGMPIGE